MPSLCMCLCLCVVNSFLLTFGHVQHYLSDKPHLFAFPPLSPAHETLTKGSGKCLGCATDIWNVIYRLRRSVILLSWDTKHGTEHNFSYERQLFGSLFRSSVLSFFLGIGKHGIIEAFSPEHFNPAEGRQCRKRIKDVLLCNATLFCC